MKFEDIEHCVDEFFAVPLNVNEDELKDIQNAYQIMSDDIKEMIAGKKVEQNEKKIVSVIDSMLTISKHVLNAPINEVFANFVTAYSELAYNWNNNLYQDELLRQLPIYMGRIIESRDAMVKMTKIIKEIDERMRDLSTWSPPAYEIATDYFEKLLKENEKE